jgi:aminoglycoside phosphotransferase (APT) family kinase protein
MQMHAGQLDIEAAAVRRLVRKQFPQWAGLPVLAVASPGTVNAIFRIGDGLVARFPLQPAEVAATRRWLEREAAAARELVGATRFPTPEPVAIGEPGAGYPLPWTVNTWLPGTVATEQDPSGSEAYARDLADLIQALRAVDTRGRTFHGTNRGSDLQSRDDWMQECIDRSGELLDVAWLSRTWAALRTLPRTSPDAMTHGDLIPGNLLVADGRLTGVLDVGEFGPADPALDLVSAWHGLATGPRQVFRKALRCDDLEWARGAAWAFEQALGVVWYYAQSNPAASAMGRRTLLRIAADFAM